MLVNQICTYLIADISALNVLIWPKDGVEICPNEAVSLRAEFICPAEGVKLRPCSRWMRCSRDQKPNASEFIVLQRYRNCFLIHGVTLNIHQMVWLLMLSKSSFLMHQRKMNWRKEQIFAPEWSSVGLLIKPNPTLTRETAIWKSK